MLARQSAGRSVAAGIAALAAGFYGGVRMGVRKR
jgi:hypothetical protein